MEKFTPAWEGLERRRADETPASRIEETDGTTVICLSGTADLHTAPTLQNMLEPTQTTSAHIVVDLSRLTDMDAAGFRVLETCSQRSRWRGRRMFLAGTDRLGPQAHRCAVSRSGPSRVPLCGGSADGLPLSSRVTPPLLF